MGRIQWTKELLTESARRFRTKKEWEKGDHKAYHACARRNWLNDPDITGHMVATKESWDKPKLVKSARRFRTKGEWKAGDLKAYTACQKRGWLDDPDIAGHMVAVLEDWDKPKLVKSARRFRTKYAWEKGDRNAYQACHNRGWLDDPDITGHMVAVHESWDKPKLVKSARRFLTRGGWKEGDYKAYKTCRNRGWLDDPDITGHMVAVLEDWDKPKLVKSARRFNTRGEWLKGDSKAYNACLRRGWLDDSDITGHMVAGDTASDNDAVYLYRLEIARVVLYKVGLTSISRGTVRICNTVRAAGTTAHDVHIWPVEDARETEKKMLELGQPQNVYKGDGHTEMRVFTPEEVRQAVALAEADSTGPAILFENL